MTHKATTPFHHRFMVLAGSTRPLAGSTRALAESTRPLAGSTRVLARSPGTAGMAARRTEQVCPVYSVVVHTNSSAGPAYLDGNGDNGTGCNEALCQLDSRSYWVWPTQGRRAGIMLMMAAAATASSTSIVDAGEVPAEAAAAAADCAGDEGPGKGDGEGCNNDDEGSDGDGGGGSSDGDGGDHAPRAAYRKVSLTL
jgi:hypothetical protein